VGATTVLLFADNDAARRTGREGLQHDLHIQLLVDDLPESTRCNWSLERGAKLFVVITASGADYELVTYDAQRCRAIPRLSAKFRDPETPTSLAADLSAQSARMPALLTLDDKGLVHGDVHDGFYSVHRRGKYMGDVKRRGEFLMPMYWPLDVESGDVFIERSQRQFVDLGLDAIAGWFSDRAPARSRSGAGVHLRYYSIDGGVQFGIQAEGFDAARSGYSFILTTGELGWGLRMTPGLVVSANLGIGRTFVLGADQLPDYNVWAFVPTIRLQTFVTRRVHASLDAGVAAFDYGFKYDDYGTASSFKVRAPISRITVGIDL
jgi:hypothetical protein